MKVNRVGVWFRRYAAKLLRLVWPYRRLNQELNQLQLILSDWAQLRVYQACNAVLPPPAVHEDRVVFFGDSITQFWPLGGSFPGKPYLNRGISGQTTGQMLIRFWPDVVALRPKVVLLLAGTNDIAGNTGPMTLDMIKHNLTAIAQLAQVNRIQVIMASVLPIHDYGSVPQSQQRPPIQIEALNDWLKQYCDQQGHVYVDYYSHMVDHYRMLRADLADDGIHPNGKGYSVMAPLAEIAIQQSLQNLTQIWPEDEYER
ncbi:SGNH/GDSL hydrolase family protein [Leptolyngbya sp. AN02str]|uniref:SGNH/GDSL hydrolase family protein n=1 Tax=Leptolyngbya sp. AN02str TaxID=3423363 RepID=UPI003D30FBBE